MRFPHLLAFTALCLAGCGSEKAQQPRAVPLVEAAPVATATFTDRLEAVGTALANEQVVLSAPVTERITSINFADGAYVKKGQVIATLDGELSLAQKTVVIFVGDQ